MHPRKRRRHERCSAASCYFFQFVMAYRHARHYLDTITISNSASSDTEQAPGHD